MCVCVCVYVCIYECINVRVCVFPNSGSVHKYERSVLVPNISHILYIQNYMQVRTVGFLMKFYAICNVLCRHFEGKLPIFDQKCSDLIQI